MILSKTDEIDDIVARMKSHVAVLGHGHERRLKMILIQEGMRRF